MIGIPVLGDVITDEHADSPGASPEHVEVTIYIVDFNRFDVGAGSVGVDFYGSSSFHVGKLSLS